MTARGLRATTRVVATSTFCYVLAFNLVFFVQELALVLTKTMIPGLHPVLLHDDHAWSGHHPLEEIAQGAGAVAIGVLAIVAAAWWKTHPDARPEARLFAAWLVYQGAIQSLQQVLLAAFFGMNDVGRALGWLGADVAGKRVLAALALVAMIGLSRNLAAWFVSSASPRPGRALFTNATLPALVGTLLVIPYRVPGSLLEVVLVPLLVVVDGVLWMQLRSLSLRSSRAAAFDEARPAVPLVACIALLVLFQHVLRPGVAFS